jgi:biopolymer transport protein ExbB/TolQ
MKHLFLTGGPIFMSILSVLLIVMVAWILFHYLAFISGKQNNGQLALQRLNYGRSIGLFALITGVLGQMMGLYMAFFAIERAADISPAIIMGGIKVSMISTIYGILIYLLSLVLWFVFSYLVGQKTNN